MMVLPLRRRRLLVAGLALFGVCGCGTAGLNGFLMELGQPRRITDDDLETHRAKFVQERDPAAFRWLLAHALQNGMPLAEVHQALGEVGELIYDDKEIKANDGKILQTDLVYKWGPTTDGKSAVLFFRDGRLIHYDSKDYAMRDVPESF